MAITHRLVLAALAQAVLRVVAHGLEQAEAGLVALRLGHDEVLVGQRGQQVQHLAAVDAVAAAHMLGGLECPAAGEHRGTPQHRLLGIAQQLVAPVDQRAQRAVTRQCRARPAGQHAEAVVEPLAQLLQRHHAHPRRRQLDGQRDAVQAAADRRQRRSVLVRHVEVRPLQPGAIDEQARRLAGQDFLAGRVLPPPATDSDGTRYVSSPSMPRRSRLVTRIASSVAAAQQQLGELRTRIEQMLGVVQHQQQLPRSEPFGHRLHEVLARLLRDAEGFRHGLGNERRVAQRGQLDEPDAIRILVEHRARHLQRQPRLAAAAGTGERQQSRGGQPSLDLRDLLVAADEARQGLRQVVPRLRRRRGRLLHGRHVEGEAVPLSGDGRDGVRAQHLAQRRDMRLQGVLFDDHLAPDPRQQLRPW